MTLQLKNITHRRLIQLNLLDGIEYIVAMHRTSSVRDIGHE